MMMRKLLLAGVLSVAGSLPAFGAAGTCPGEGQIKSASTAIDSKITFENNSGAERQIFWIDFEGARVQYGKIAPGATHVQPTFLGHAWVITDQNADCLGFYFAETEPRLVALGGADRAPVAGAPPIAPGVAPPRVQPRGNNASPAGTPLGGTGLQGGRSPAAVDDSPCEPGEYWNRSRNLCIDTQTKRRRKPSAALPRPDAAVVRTLRCRPGFAQSGTRCIRQAEATPAPRPQRPQPAPAAQAAPGDDPWTPGALAADPDNEENRADDLCGPGFTDIGGGCISNSLLE